MTNTNPASSLRRGSAIFALFVLLGHVAPAAAADSLLVQCRQGVETGYSSWLKRSLKLTIGCFRDILAGLESSRVNCVTGTGDINLAIALRTADARLAAKMAASCKGINWSLLSFPGPCDAGASVFDSEALTDCIAVDARARLQALFTVWAPSPLGKENGDAGKCLGEIPRHAAAMVQKEMKTRLKCLLGQERSDSLAGVDCRAQLPPYGPGTGSEAVDKTIVDAHRAWLAGLPRTCGEVDFRSLGLGAFCPEPYGPSDSLVDFQACVYGANRLAVPVLADFAFPSSPVCGNDILQEGEACDDGARNSDTTGDACRLDCTLPVCGDHTTDPGHGEQCDDGNFDALDGCTADCGLEFCGDGITNNLPPAECDDGNTNAHDTCTAACRVAACGDGAVCSDPSCTSGPGGGPEACDLGTANADNGLCRTDCSGYSRSCTLAIGVTNTVKLGALTYEMSYKDADGDVLGSAGQVKCKSAITGGLVSFFDNETKRTVKESLIVDAGVQAPATIATCDYATNDAGLAGTDFSFTIQAASDTNFEPVTAVMAVTNVTCTP